MAPAQQQAPPPPRTKVLERCRVSPAPGPGGGAPAALPLTFFDYLFLPFHPVQRVFFYALPCSRSSFLDEHLPHLKLSLSLALREFRPLAGSLVLGGRPEVRCRGGDGVAFAAAESRDDFHHLAGNHPREAARLHPLVPTLGAARAESAPVLALQVTLFPGAGIALGVAVQHAVADGSTSAHFLKTWSAACGLGRKGAVGAACAVGGSPSYDRTIMAERDSCLGRRFLADLEALKGDRRLEAWDRSGRADLVRSTVVVGSEQIQQLRRRAAAIRGTALEHCSPYSLAVGFVWACLVRAKGGPGGGGERSEHFGFVAGCRARMEPPAPATYFGNCLGICHVEASRGDLVGEDGAAAAAAAIWEVVRGLEGGGVFRGAERWVQDIFRLAPMGILTVAGSPKLGMYQVDFGWGRPVKVEVVSIERTGAMSVAEVKDGGGGLEIGLVLPKDEMKRFGTFFSDGLKQLSLSS